MLCNSPQSGNQTNGPKTEIRPCAFIISLLKRCPLSDEYPNPLTTNEGQRETRNLPSIFCLSIEGVVKKKCSSKIFEKILVLGIRHRLNSKGCFTSSLKLAVEIVIGQRQSQLDDDVGRGKRREFFFPLLFYNYHSLSGFVVILPR